jgi:hypothetical protein
VDQFLKAAFLKLFSVANCKEASMADVLQIHNGVSQWNITFIRSVIFCILSG